MRGSTGPWSPFLGPRLKLGNQQTNIHGLPLLVLILDPLMQLLPGQASLVSVAMPSRRARDRLTSQMT